MGVITIHFCQELLAPRALQGVFDLPGAIQRVLHGPDGWNPRVDHCDAILKVGERLKVQPFDQLLAIGRIKDVIEVVFAVLFAGTTGDSH